MKTSLDNYKAFLQSKRKGEWWKGIKQNFEMDEGAEKKLETYYEKVSKKVAERIKTEGSLEAKQPGLQNKAISNQPAVKAFLAGAIFVGEKKPSTNPQSLESESSVAEKKPSEQPDDLRTLVGLIRNKTIGIDDNIGEGRTLLHCAILTEQNNLKVESIQVILLFLALGANPNCVDVLGKTPLHYAAQKYPTSSMLLLLSGANPLIKDQDSKDALDYAAEALDTDIFSMIASVVCGEKDIKDANGQTFLHKAVTNGTTKNIKFAIEKGVNLEAQDDKGKTALDYAAEHINCEAFALIKNKGEEDDIGGCLIDQIVSHLIAKEADVKNIKSADGKNLLHHMAMSSQNTELVKTLISKGLDKKTIDNVGKTPWHYASMCQKFAMTEALKRPLDKALPDKPIGLTDLERAHDFLLNQQNPSGNPMFRFIKKAWTGQGSTPTKILVNKPVVLTQDQNNEDYLECIGLLWPDSD